MYFTLFLSLTIAHFSQAQTVADNYASAKRTERSSARINLNGQWRGSFNEGSGNPSSLISGSSTTYVLELDINGSKVSGYSYTYFTDIGPKRYYTICRVTGSVDRATNSLVVTEIERVKYNTPPYILNCFQIHKLRYEKGQGNTEYLKGEWEPAPNQNCSGRGQTVLSRETVSRTPFAIKMPPKKDEVAKSAAPAPARRHPVRQTPPKPGTEKETAPTTRRMTTDIPVENKKIESVTAEAAPKADLPPMAVYKGYQNRKNTVAKTIQIENPVFQVDFYDNGIVDGDSISVFFNGKLIASNKMLTEKPLTLTLSFDKNYKRNIITMYAENLGSIPPNTAVMIVRDGNTRHEARMESDMGKSASVIFTHKESD